MYRPSLLRAAFHTASCSAVLQILYDVVDVKDFFKGQKAFAKFSQCTSVSARAREGEEGRSGERKEELTVNEKCGRTVIHFYGVSSLAMGVRGG